MSAPMSRLCERPGCSDPASVAYGMRAEDLVFWLAAIVDSREIDGGVLCRRHADTMVVPRGWTLDDLRDPDLHLFRPPTRSDDDARRPRRRRRNRSGDHTEQLELGGLAAAIEDVEVGETEADAATASAESDGSIAEVATDAANVNDPPAPARRNGALAWKPAFDDGDDLDGLLSARSPLLSRAFRGTDRDE